MIRSSKIAILFLLLLMSLSACNAIGNSTSPALMTVDIPQAEVFFLVEVPDTETSPGSVMLNIVDELTGLALNPTTIKMQKRDNTHFSLKIQVNIDTVLKYRYSRSGALPIMETGTNGEGIRYRIAMVDAPMTIYDVVPAWEDHAFQGGTGKITGSVINLVTNTPVPNLLVTAGGLTSFTASDGSFVINNLPPGTHNLIVYSMDGSYQPFQQGATIESGLTTPADIKVIPGQIVNITFLLNAPDEYDGMPIRLAGNITQLGNTFSDLSGGMSVLASRMPILAGLDDGRRYVTISISAGTYIEYKYTLGDGFWNSELDDQGRFNLRGYVVPTVDSIVQDEVTTWHTKDTEPIKFEVYVPENTPPEDRIAIQFNPFGWMEPIPMWPTGDKQWSYIVYNPLNLAGNFTYRYCRNEQCGIADDSATAGFENPGRTMPVGENLIQDSVDSWRSFGPSTSITLDDAVIPYGQSYLTGIEFSPLYQPGWQPYMTGGLNEVQSTGANTIILTPTWTFDNPSQPVCDLVPGINPSWQETYEQIWHAKQLDLTTMLYPTVRFTTSSDDWWLKASRTTDWWQVWYTGYRRFITHYADLAQQAGVEYLVIGGDWIQPSLPGGILSDGNDSQAPPDSIIYWTDIINSIRSHYSGKIVWQLGHPRSLGTPPPFLGSMDAIYVTLSGSVSASAAPGLTELQDGFAGIIDSSVYPLVELYGKPVFIGIEYPSSSGSAGGCMLSSASPCGELDAVLQAELYRAALTVVNYRDWLSGFISQGYYPAARLIDTSSSIHGKPAEELLGYWYPYITGPTQ